MVHPARFQGKRVVRDLCRGEGDIWGSGGGVANPARLRVLYIHTGKIALPNVD